MSYWQSEQLFQTGDQYYQALFNSWSRARRSIDFEVYIFEPGQLAKRVESELMKAAQRGVDVRLIVDGMGSTSWVRSESPRLLNESGAQVRVFNPFLTAEIFSQIFKGLIPMWEVLRPAFKARRNPFIRRLNRRTHRKLSIVDGENAFVGSINVADDHLETYSGRRAWRDSAVSVTGPATALLEESFQYHWRRSVRAPFKARVRIPFQFRRKRPKGLTAPIGFTHRFHLRTQHRRRVMQTIQDQYVRIWIANPYLAPPSGVVRKLVRAAQRGVDVRVLIPQHSDVWFMPLIAQAYYRNLMKGGVRIFEYTPSFLHAKIMIFDSVALLGTSNLNRRSFLHDSEVDLWLNQPATLEKLVADFHLDIENSVEVCVPPGWWVSRIGRILNYLIRYWV